MNTLYYNIRISYRWFLLLCTTCLSLASCKQDADVSNVIFIRQTVNSPVVPLAMDGGQGESILTIGSSYTMDIDEEVTIAAVGQDYLDNFNRQNFTEYKLVPVSAVTFSSQSVTIASGTALGKENITVNVKEWPGYIEGTQYVVPVQIKPQKYGVLSGSDVALLLVTKTIVGAAAQNANLTIPVSIFGPDAEGKTYDKFTFEGRFNMTKSLGVAGNWRSDIFNGCGLQFLVFSDGKIDIRFPDARFMTSTVTATLNTWYHYAITYTDGVATLYINGQLVGQIPYAGLKLSDCAITPYATGTGATVSEVRIWKTLRTPRQMRSFVCAVDPSDPNLVGYWKLNEGSGNKVMDSSAKGQHLTSETNITWVSGVRCPN